MATQKRICSNCQVEYEANSALSKYCDQCRPLMREKRKQLRAEKKGKVAESVVAPE